MNACSECGNPSRRRVCSRCQYRYGQDKWSTHDELSFLNAHAQSGRLVKGAFLTSSEFLRGYLAGAELRTDWSGLDREVIIGTAQALLDAKAA